MIRMGSLASHEERRERRPSGKLPRQTASKIALGIWKMDGLKDTVPLGKPYSRRASEISDLASTEQQIDILKERGLLIDDLEQAIEALENISYFRLAGYWRHFEADRITHQFRAGSRFAGIIGLYSFDKELRALLFTAIQTIEPCLFGLESFSSTFGFFIIKEKNIGCNRGVCGGNRALQTDDGMQIELTEKSSDNGNRNLRHANPSLWE